MHSLSKPRAQQTLAFSPGEIPSELKNNTERKLTLQSDGMHDENDAGIPLPPGDKSQPRRSWYLGIQSKKDPAHVMAEVFRSLRSLRCQWHVLSPYRLLCRWRPLCSGLADHPCADVWLYASLQVYKIQPKVYLLDFQRIGSHSNTLAWMNMCTLIINSLKPPSRSDRSSAGAEKSNSAGSTASPQQSQMPSPSGSNS